jgi:ppGpp synthetase/RelA/SpoT-type nucleotidyltranferase
MAKKKEIKDLEAEYRATASIAERFASQLCEQIKHLLDNERVLLSFPIQSRVKTWGSIFEKLDRVKLSLSKLTDLNDLVGLRLILQFRRDINRVCDLISHHFKVVAKYDTQDKLKDDQFGYSSIHFVVEMPEPWLTVPTLADMKGLRAEIQVRTTAQHIWAAASHTLQYKREESVPPQIRRSIYRVSALLETVDLEFERLLGEREKYREEIVNTEVIRPIDLDEKLNVDLIEKILDDLLPRDNKDTVSESYGELLEDLITFNIVDRQQLTELLQKHSDSVMEEDARIVERQREQIREGAKEILGTTQERVERGVYYTHVGLVRLALGVEFGDKWDSYNWEKSERNRQGED